MITIKDFVFNTFATNTYVVSDNDTKKCVIIDPACSDTKEELELTKYIEDNNLTPVAILNTHFHVDHLVGINFIKDKYKIDLYGHKDEDYLINEAETSAELYGFNISGKPQIDKFLNENDVFEFGNTKINVLHVPGHTKGSLAYYINEPKVVFSGDVLFNGSIGRTDLQGGNLETLLKSIKEKMFQLPPETTVFSGHGPETTIVSEINSNPFLLDNVM